MSANAMVKRIRLGPFDPGWATYPEIDTGDVAVDQENQGWHALRVPVPAGSMATFPTKPTAYTNAALPADLGTPGYAYVKNTGDVMIDVMVVLRLNPGDDALLPLAPTTPAAVANGATGQLQVIVTER